MASISQSRPQPKAHSWQGPRSGLECGMPRSQATAPGHFVLELIGAQVPRHMCGWSLLPQERATRSSARCGCQRPTQGASRRPQAMLPGVPAIPGHQTTEGHAPGSLSVPRTCRWAHQGLRALPEAPGFSEEPTVSSLPRDLVQVTSPPWLQLPHLERDPRPSELRWGQERQLGEQQSQEQRAIVAGAPVAHTGRLGT